ncbi:MAG: nucleotide sugar dehydrogenase [Flavobacteriales bacterium]|nr:nucleotide sugar dehydrogenase [Flavobacteriales bacterium]
MNVSIFGLGYVGCVSMACLAKVGHKVIGVDVSNEKIDLINQGRSTIVETDVDELISEARQKNLVSATLDAYSAVMDSDISIICVGTPNNERGNLNLKYIEQTGQSIAEGIKDKHSFHVVAIRSTVVPGTCANLSSIIEKVSGKKANQDFAVLSNPEFLREGSAVYDYFNPPMTVLGSEMKQATEMMKQLYSDLEAPVVEVETKVAEVIKFVNNSYHALKITFANEIGNICKSLEIDSHEVMNLFGQDTKLNISTAYFKPGFAYGGSCLPKDLSGLVAMGKDNHLRLPVLESIGASNQEQIEKALKLVYSCKKSKIGMLGLSFKEGTDDLRLSPHVEVAENLIGKGYNLRIFDRNVRVSSLLGKNKSYVDAHLPHLNELITDDADAVIAHSEVLIVCHRSSEFKDLQKQYPNKIIIDLNRNSNSLSNGNYHGICW